MLRLPISSNASQRFSTTVGDSVYIIEIRYNSRYASWLLDVSKNNIQLVTGLPMLPGVNITEYHLNIEGLSDLRNLFILDLSNPIGDVTYENFSTEARAFLLTNSELLQVVS